MGKGTSSAALLVIAAVAAAGPLAVVLFPPGDSTSPAWFDGDAAQTGFRAPLSPASHHLDPIGGLDQTPEEDLILRPVHPASPSDIAGRSGGAGKETEATHGSNPAADGPGGGNPSPAERDERKGFARDAFYARAATGPLREAERRDPLPGELADWWPAAPEPWRDEFGETHDPLAKVVNPPVEISEFWVKDPAHDPLEPEKQGSFEVKTDRPAQVEDGRTTILKGRVADAATGTGLCGASVVLFSTFYKPLVNYTHHLKEVAAATSQLDGTFSIPGFNVDDIHFGASGKVFLTVSCQGYAARAGVWIETLVPGHENDAGTILMLAGGQVVRGHVLDRTGLPVRGAVVAFTGEIYPTEYSKDQRYAFLARFPNAACGPDGAFEVKGVSGRHWVTVHFGRDCVSSAMMEFADSGLREGLVFRVLAGGKIEGKIVDASDKPIADAVVSCASNSTHSYADGSFCLENIEGDSLDILVHHHLFKCVPIKNVPVGLYGMKIAMLDPLPRVVLRVLWADTREPVEQVRITAYMNGAPGGEATPDPVMRLGEPRLSTSSSGLHALVVPEFAAGAHVLAEAAFSWELLDLAAARDGQEFDVLLKRAESK